MYSLGCVVYEMLTGEPPYTGPTAVAVVTRHAVSPIPPIRTIRADASDAIERALIRALAKAPADRFATADEFALALEAHSTGAKPTVEAKATVTLEGSIAVLPFADLSRDRDQAYLCEGIAEELMDALSRLGSLQVASRTSAFALKGQNLDVREIGRRLNVRSVLEGAVRAAGDRLRVSVTLTNVEDGYQSWSVRYDRAMTDVFEVQDEIARTVVSRLQPQSVSGAPVVAPGASDPEAYRAYLLGRHFANRRTESDLRQAIASFESGLAREPGFALAAAGLADAWFMLGVYGAVAPDEAMQRAKRAVEQAEASGRETAEALAVRGVGTRGVRLELEWRRGRLPARPGPESRKSDGAPPVRGQLFVAPRALLGSRDLVASGVGPRSALAGDNLEYRTASLPDSAVRRGHQDTPVCRGSRSSLRAGQVLPRPGASRGRTAG